MAAVVTGAVIIMAHFADMENLEYLLRKAIAEGQPRTHRPWKKVSMAAGCIMFLTRVADLSLWPTRRRF